MVDGTMILKLYVSGDRPRSRMAVQRLEQLCAGQPDVRVEIIDVLAEPAAAEAAHILATPTLIKELPLPPQRILGDLSDVSMVRTLLNLSPDGAC